MESYKSRVEAAVEVHATWLRMEAKGFAPKDITEPKRRNTERFAVIFMNSFESTIQNALRDGVSPVCLTEFTVELETSDTYERMLMMVQFIVCRLQVAGYSAWVEETHPETESVKPQVGSNYKVMMRV